MNGNLPSLAYVKSVNLESEVYQKIFKTFVSYVHDNKEEPNYSEMGCVFNLLRICDSKQDVLSRYFKSVCYSILSESQNEALISHTHSVHMCKPRAV